MMTLWLINAGLNALACVMSLASCFLSGDVRDGALSASFAASAGLALWSASS